MGETIEQVMARYNSINLALLPQVSQEAIKKLRESKTNKHTELIVAGLVLAIADGDEGLAQKIVSQQEKTLSTCYAHIKSWAMKKAIDGCAAIDHEDVWSEAIHYYLDVVEKKSTPLPVKKFEPPVEIEKPVDDGSLSLFGDDDFEEPAKDNISMSLFGDDFE